MPWGRIDDGHWRHRKVAALHDDLRKPCLALFWLAVSWSNDQGTDGRVTGTGLRQLDGTREEAEELVRVGLWDRDGSGYQIHNFLDFNKSSEQVAQDRAQRSAAGAAGAAKRWSDSESSSTPNSDSLHGEHGGDPNEMDAPYPVSRTPVIPSPAPDARDGLPHITDEAARFLEGITGRTVLTAGHKQLAEYDRQLEAHGEEVVFRAYRRIAKSMTNPTARQLVWSALRVLEPFVTPTDIKRLEAKEREDDEKRAHAARLEATRQRIKELSA